MADFQALPQALPDMGQCAEQAPQAQGQAQQGGRGQAHTHPAACQCQHCRAGKAQHEGHAKAPPQLANQAALPARHRAHAHQGQGRQHQRQKDGLEVRRPHGDLLAAQHIERQRVQRAYKHRQRGSGEEHVVDQQKGFAREHGKFPGAAAQLRCAPGEQPQRCTHNGHDEAQDEEPPPWVHGKGMNRGKYA